MHRLSRFAPLVATILGLTLAAGACAPGPQSKREAFAAYQAQMQAQGRLRTDREAPDVAYSNADLADHFRRIAFFNYPGDTEHVPKPLTRWEGPVNWAVYGTDADVETVDGLMQDLARLTRLRIRQVPQRDANFLVVAMTEAEQQEARATLEDAETRAFLDEFLGAVFDCGLVARWSPRNPVIDSALVYLHGDLAGLYRELCFHEEISQSLGLFNDDPTVRPSIFNDDDEFALLTTHDELLLRILYDPRLRPGMSAAEAMPIVRRIIHDIRPGQ